MMSDGALRLPLTEEITMRFQLTIDCEGPAFFDEDHGGELARIVARVAETLRNGDSYGDSIWAVRDSNGSTVGSWSLVDPMVEA